MRRTGILMDRKFNFPDSISQVRVSARRRQEKISTSVIFSQIVLNTSEASQKKVPGVKFQVLEDGARARRPRRPDCRRAAPQRYSLANITFVIAAWSSGGSFLPCAVR